MTIRKYKVVLEVQKEMTIEIDDSIITPEWMEDFSSYMFRISEHAELCEHIGHMHMFHGDYFVEGVGDLSWLNPKQNMEEMGVSVSRVEDVYEEFEVEEIK